MYTIKKLFGVSKKKSNKSTNCISQLASISEVLVIQAASPFRLVVFIASILIFSVANSSESISPINLEDGSIGTNKASRGMCLPNDSADTASDSFDGNGLLLDYTTNNASALPDVARKGGRYHAPLLNNDNNITLHFNDSQGRLDAKRLSFPFEFIARNIGIGTSVDSQLPPAPDDFQAPSSLYMFAGIQVHALDLNRRDSAHFVVGHRGSTSFTIEGKNTVNGNSWVNDAGQGIVPDARADLRVVGHADQSMSWYWQQPNMYPQSEADDWIAYRGNGIFPGSQAEFGGEVYVGLITYAYGRSSVPFVGTCDEIQWIESTQ